LVELEKRCRERVQGEAGGPACWGVALSETVTPPLAVPIVMVTKRETSEESVIAAHSRQQGRATQQGERRMRISVDAVVEQHDRALQHLNSHGSAQRRLLDKQSKLKVRDVPFSTKQIYRYTDIQI